MNPPSIEPLYGPFAWNASSLDQNGGWSVELDIDEIACLDDALNTVVSRQIAWSSLTKTQFPLPVLSQKLEAISIELEDGCGMVSIRGISPARYTPDELHTLWFGLSLHLGTPVYQNPQGQLLRDICNEGEGVGKRYGQMTSGDSVFLSSRARTASPAELRFHTDRADIVGLLCVGRAKSGGETRVASSVTVHNEMIRRQPALAAVLYAPIYRSRLGEETGGDQKFYPLPVFGCRAG
ncbi:MAG: TauD/TfdA family dioxygenase, partial [Pseudomonadota bacterium]|nr:TauD/TfdA family dioxygenase [Pseudomonadota bacterium]